MAVQSVDERAVQTVANWAAYSAALRDHAWDF